MIEFAILAVSPVAAYREKFSRRANHRRFEPRLWVDFGGHRGGGTEWPGPFETIPETARCAWRRPPSMIPR